jgi:hypothetical protein
MVLEEIRGGEIQRDHLSVCQGSISVMMGLLYLLPYTSWRHFITMSTRLKDRFLLPISRNLCLDFRSISLIDMKLGML